MRRNIQSLKQLVAELQRMKESRLSLEEAVAKSRLAVEARRQDHLAASTQAALDKSILDSHLAGRPGFFSRLFGTTSWKTWSVSRHWLSNALKQSLQRSQSTSRTLEVTQAESTEVQSRLAQLDKAIQSKQQEVIKIESAVSAARSRLGDRVIDEIFFQKGHEAIQLAAPWLPDDVHRMREDLFSAALTVHKAFIDASANRLQHNLGLLMSAMTAGTLKSPAHRDLLLDLWSSLFMVVPVVSTTFASIHAMFGDLPQESIGWLLVDEAGQAAPQASVGAILRAKRTIMVGDPLQIPPVVGLPEKLNAEICKFFDISEAEWSAPAASSQTLADQASRFRSAFKTDSGSRDVGLPLLVHRRCQSPMFEVSNLIAYAEQMVHAVGPPETGPIEKALGKSRWIDVTGDAETKWCPAEGKIVIDMLAALAESGVNKPDIFIITPFKVIEQEMRRLLETKTDLFGKLGVRADEWARDRVGTIHTFQGREARAVILLLGAPKSSQHRARQWASSPPNIINVAVSRAKHNLYVVGSATAWSAAGSSLQILQRKLKD